MDNSLTWRKASLRLSDDCTLCLSMSRVPESDAGELEACAIIDGETARTQDDCCSATEEHLQLRWIMLFVKHISYPKSLPAKSRYEHCMMSLDLTSHSLLRSRSSTISIGFTGTHLLHPRCFRMFLCLSYLVDNALFQEYTTRCSDDAQTDGLLTTVLTAVGIMLQSPRACIRHPRDCTDATVDRLLWLTYCMYALARTVQDCKRQYSKHTYNTRYPSSY